ncbi:MAG: type II toxin-antitoxin system prevent-host-death family antitoxin [Acidobacteriota bacterium]
METVGLRHLKSHLSEYVNRSRDGERIVITDRGREIAELVPLSPERKAMIALRAEGRVSWDGGKPKGLKGISVRGKPVADTILEDRR